MDSVDESPAEPRPLSPAGNPRRRPHKRVSTACDECRKKRLRCTAGPRPCLNCQLYGALCTITPTYKKRGPVPSQSKSHRRTSADPLNTFNELGPPSPDNTRSDSTAEPAKRLPDNALLPQDGNISRLDSDAYMQDLTPSLQQEEEPHFEHGQGPVSIGSYEDFAILGPEGLSHHDLALFGDLFGDSAFQNSASDMGFADWYTPQPVIQSARASMHSPRPREAGVTASKVFSSENLSDFLKSHATEKAIVPSLFVSTGSSDCGFIGFISTGATLTECLQEGSSDDILATRSKVGEYISNAAPYVHGVESHGGKHILPELPLESWAKAGIKAYFEHVHMFYPLLNENSSREYWDQLYAQRKGGTTVLDITMLHLVVAIGLLIDADMASTTASSMSEKLYQRAWESIHETMVSFELQSVQIAILHVIYHMYAGRSSKAWSICGMAVRSAQALGLHRSVPVASGFTPEQIRLRSHIWWVTFSLDATLSMTEGRPPAVAESTCDTRSMTDEWASDAPNASNLFLWKVGLAQIQNRLCSVLSRCDTHLARRSALGEIEQCLTEWRDHMPVECRPGQDMIEFPRGYSLLASLHLEYFSLARALYWSCMTCAPAKDNDTQGGSNTSGPRGNNREYKLCLGSARAFVRTLNSAIENEGNQRTARLSFQADQYIAALAILYRNICRNPAHVATRVDLGYFRACKLHLERDVYPGYLVAGFGGLMNDMLCSVEKLLARF